MRREMEEKLKTLRVLARSSPSDKHLLVTRYVTVSYYTPFSFPCNACII